MKCIPLVSNSKTFIIKSISKNKCYASLHIDFQQKITLKVQLLKKNLRWCANYKFCRKFHFDDGSYILNQFFGIQKSFVEKQFKPYRIEPDAYFGLVHFEEIYRERENRNESITRGKYIIQTHQILVYYLEWDGRAWHVEIKSHKL